MMTSLAQNFGPHPGGIPQHPGIPQQHPMAHNPNQPGQPGPGMPQQMHMGVSGPGPQVSQAGAMMGGIPPGIGGPSAHALQHLNPGQQQAQFLQQQQMFANNPQLQQQMHQQQQQMQIQAQRAQAARQAMLAQQYSGIQPGMPNGMNQMTQAQFQAMRGGGPMARPVNLPQHLQQQQQQAQHAAQQHNLEQQQAQQQAQHQHQQQMLAAQQMALQHQAAQGQNPNSNQGQPNPMNPQQLQMQAQIAAAQAHQQQQHAAANQQSQPQPQNPSQQPQPTPQPQPQQPQQQLQGQQANAQQHQQQVAAAAMMQQQQRQGEKLKGQCLMKLMQFSDHLSGFTHASRPLQSYMTEGITKVNAQSIKQQEDLQYWSRFANQFFSPRGVLRHSVWIPDENSNKQFEISFPALARYFHTHFESGVQNMQMITEKAVERELPNNGHYIESQKSSFVYWFDNKSHLIANGNLKAHFDADQKLELLEFITSSHEEYLPRNRIIEAARPLHEWQKEWHKVNNPPDGKPSPEMNKKKAKMMKSPQQPPPEIDLPGSKVKPNMGITKSVFRFLEVAEVMVQMNPLFSYCHQNPTLSPPHALDQYVAANAGAGNIPGAQPGPQGPRTPGMANFPMGSSPAAAHLQLPGSPHIGGSPAQAPGMIPQHSQHGTNSSGPSANTSPNASNKRRRPSAVKAEDENQLNGTQAGKTAVKPSPRIGGKRQKGNPA